MVGLEVGYPIYLEWDTWDCGRDVADGLETGRGKYVIAKVVPKSLTRSTLDQKNKFEVSRDHNQAREDSRPITAESVGGVSFEMQVRKL